MTRPRKLLAALLTLAMLGSVVAGSGAAAAQTDASMQNHAISQPTALAQTSAVFLSVDATTTPDMPTTEEEFDLDVTITSADAGSSNAYINRISLVNSTGDDPKRYATDFSVGQITPGEELRHTLADLEFDEEGTYDLYLDLTVRAGGRTFHVYEPVTIQVYDGHPVVEAQAAESMPGRFTDLSVSVGNGLDGDVRNVELELASESVTVEGPRRVASQIAAGETRTFDFRAKTDSPGENTIEATIRYTAEGERRHVTRTLTPAFSQPEFADDVTVSGQVEPAFPGAQTTLNLTVSNGLDVSLRQLEVSVDGEGVEIPQPQRVSGGIDSGETRTYTFAVSRETAGSQPFEVQLSYITDNGASQTLTKTVDTAFIEPRNPGEVSLTGLQVERDGDSLLVSGTASNIGGDAVSGVTVAVGSNDQVRPGRSQAEFFVGSIPESDFVSFDVNARLAENASTVQIPLEVTYTVDGVRLTEQVSVAYEPEPTPTQPRGNGGLPMGALIGGAVVLALLVVGLVYWRRR